VSRVLEAREISREFVKPYWERFARFYKLYRGEITEDLDTTYTQVFLHILMALVGDLLPRDVASVFSVPDWVQLEATEPELEPYANVATKWLQYQANERFNLPFNLIPTFQSVHVFGTAFRHVSSVWDTVETPVSSPTAMFSGVPLGFQTTTQISQRWRLTDQALDIFSVYPAPNGGLINPVDNNQECAVDWLGIVDWMTESRIKQLAAAGIFDGDEVAAMLESRPREDDFEETYKEKMRVARDENSAGSPGWLSRMSNLKHQPRRRRIERWYFRDKWIFVADQKYVLYNGPGLPGGIFPVAKYTDKLDFENLYGIGTVEVVEDVALARNQMANLRMDYLAQQVYPTRIVNPRLYSSNANHGDFSTAPDKEIVAPAGVRPNEAIWYDRYPELSPQAFAIEKELSEYFNEISGHSPAMRGQGSQMAYATSTGIISSIEQGNARNSMRALTLEGGGLRDELWLMLLNGALYMDHDEAIRFVSDDGLPWMTVEPEMISERYGIKLRGARDLANKQVMLAQVLQLYPLFANDPYVRDPVRLRREVAERFGIFSRPGELFGEPTGPMGPGGAPAGEQGEAGPGVFDVVGNEGRRAGRNQMVGPGVAMSEGG